MSTLVITIVTPMTVSDVTDQLQGVGTVITPDHVDRIARLVDGYANGAFNRTSVTVAVS